jgi:hypothetical protein
MSSDPLVINAYHDVIQARRQEADTEAFKQEMKIRAGIEGTVSEMIRSHSLRRPRYCERRKNQLQVLFVAAATNLKRLALRSLVSAWPKGRPLYWNGVWVARVIQQNPKCIRRQAIRGLTGHERCDIIGVAIVMRLALIMGSAINTDGGWLLRKPASRDRRGCPGGWLLQL